MRKKVMSWVLTAAMLLSTLGALPFTAAAEPTPTYVCQVDGTQYDTLDGGLSAVTDGGTVTLLADITYSSTIIANAKTITIDLNGCDLTVEGVDGHGLWAYSGGSLTIKDLAGGNEGGTLTVDSLGGRDSLDREKYCAYAESGGQIDVTGTFTARYPGIGDTYGIIALFATGTGSSITLTGSATGQVAGAYAVNNAVITVSGNVTGSYYGAYSAYGGKLDITGDVTSANRGLTVEYGGIAKIVGDIEGATGVDTCNNEFWSASVIDITGDVIATGTSAVNASWDADIDIDGSLFANESSGYGIIASETANVAVTGSITAKNGIMMSYTGAVATVGGDIISNSGIGINIDHGGMATVEGEITGASAYIRLNSTDFDAEDYGGQIGGYNVYQAVVITGEDTIYSTARVKIALPAVCEVNGVEYNSLDAGLTAAAVDWDTVKLLDDIDYNGQLDPDFDLYINLNGHTLNVTNDAGAALIADGYSIGISGEGEFNVIGSSSGVIVGENASAEVTNVTATAANGVGVDIGYETSSIQVYGDVTAKGDGGAFGVAGRGDATINGNVYAQGTNGTGVAALGSADITVKGYIEALNYISLDGTIRTEGIYDSIINNYFVYTNGLNTVRARQEVCTLNGAPYLFLEYALADAVEGDTIALLADIRYQNEIVLIEKDLTLDLGSYTLDVGRTGSDGALKVDGSTLTVDYSGGGEFNIVDGYVGIRALNEGSVTVTSISGLNGYGILGESDSSVTVLEDISCANYVGCGISLYSRATVHVLGDVYTLDGIIVQESGSLAVIDGNISATNGQGAYVTNGGAIVVNGNITAETRGVVGGYNGGTIHVKGDVAATRWEGVYAFSDSDIVIDGSVTSGYGLYAYGDGTTVLVKGNVHTTSAAQESSTEPTYGAYAAGGGEITVNGMLTPAVLANFVKVGGTVMTEADGLLDGHFTTFSDGESSVYLKGIEFFKEDFEDGTMEGWAQTAGFWSVTNTLSHPPVAPHSGSYAAMFSSYALESDLPSRFYQTQPLNLSKGTDYRLEFWMYHDSDWVADDSITVQISTDGGNNWVDLGTFARYSEIEGWREETVDLSTYVGQPDVRIAFLGSPDDGNNMFIDDFTVSHVCIIDGCQVTEAYGGYIQSSEIEGETYYHVSTPEQLAHINEHMGLKFIQTADIDLAGYNGGKWEPIGGFGNPENYSQPEVFTGEYLGDGHEIQNLYFYFNDAGQNAVHAGLFASVDGPFALVRGLTVRVAGADLTCYNYPRFGGIASMLESGTIRDCDVVIEGDIVTSLTDSEANPNGEAGGIAAYAWSSGGAGSIEGCTVTLASGSIEAAGWSKSAGGIVGNGSIPITDCHVVINEGEFIRSTYVGGIAGRFYKSYAITDCTVTGGGSLELAGNRYYGLCVGGIVGWTSDAVIENCRNEVAVDASGIAMIAYTQSAYAGGIAGYLGSGSSVLGCDNMGDVDICIAENVVGNGTPYGNEYVYAGGIAGFINGYSRASVIENCQNNADVISTNLIATNRAYAGGIVGHMDSGNADTAGVTIRNCANIGSDKSVEAYAATTLTGGIAGSSTFADLVTPNITIENCYNRSRVYSKRNNPPKKDTMCIGVTSGGIVGAAREITVKACYSTAPDVLADSGIEGDAYYGGVVGLIYDAVYTQTYYETNANVTKAAGGIVSGMGIVAQSDVSGSYQGATAQNLMTKSFFGSVWKWYTGDGVAPDYYSASAPWRMTSATSYPALRGAAYTTSTPPSGGGGSAVVTYTVTATAGVGGTISPSGSVTVVKLASQTFTVTAAAGYKIADVKVDGSSVGAVSAYTFDAVSAKHTIEANFEKMSQIEMFSDVDPALWYAQGIEFVLTRGLFKGITDKTFEPNTAMTRAMLVTVLHRLAGNPSAGMSELFADVEEGSWFDEAVRWANANGVVKGYGDATFGPGISLTREQLAVILFRYAELSGYDTTARADLTVYSDAASVASWAQDAMRWAVAMGLITGTSGDTLDAGDPAGRAQVATILMRFVQTIAK